MGKIEWNRAPEVFNPSDVPKTEELVAKIWELLRRNKSFQEAVHSLRKLDIRAAIETERYCEAARQYNELTSNKSATDDEVRAVSQRFDQLKERPLRSKATGIIEQRRQTHPLAALAMTWLCPEPEFIIYCKRDGRMQEGRGISPRLEDKSWVWRHVYSRGGRKIPRVGGESCVRGPSMSASTLTNPFSDWQNWKPCESLFDCTTPWNRLPKSFRLLFFREFSACYDSRDVCEVDYVPPPRQRVSYSLKAGARYLEFLETVTQHRLFAIPPMILTTKDVGIVFQSLQNQLKRGLPKNRDLLFGSKSAWKHYVAIKERNLSIRQHLGLGSGNSAQITEKVRNQRKNVQYGVKAIEKLIALAYPVFEIKKAVLIHSAPPRDKIKRRKLSFAKPASK